METNYYGPLLLSRVFTPETMSPQLQKKHETSRPRCHRWISRTRARSRHVFDRLKEAEGNHSSGRRPRCSEKGRLRYSASLLPVVSSVLSELHLDMSCAPHAYGRCLLNSDLHRISSNPGSAYLNACRSLCGIRRHSKIHLVSIHRAGEAHSTQHLRSLSIYSHLDR
jgi:hypothetical protein